MAFHQRKLLPVPKINPFEKTQVLQLKYYDVNCTDECSDAPSPLIVINEDQLNQSQSISPILILMFCILGAACILVCYLTLVQKYRSDLYNSRRRNPPSLDNTHEEFSGENHGPIVDHHVWFINTVGLQQSVIDSIAIFNYKRDERLVEGSECSVCLSEFQDDESLRLLPKCSHAFHIPCIDTWLSSHKNCPLCRAPIVSDSNDADLSTEDTTLNEFGSRVETPVESLESHQGGEDGNNDLGVGAENFGALPIEEGKICENLEKNSWYLNARNCGVRVESDLANHSAKVEEELQQVRRSISLDSSTASMIYLAVANIRPVLYEGCSDNQSAQAKKPNSKKVAKRGNRSNSSM